MFLYGSNTHIELKAVYICGYIGCGFSLMPYKIVWFIKGTRRKDRQEVGTRDPSVTRVKKRS